MITGVTGVVLAGGKSTRMGSDKARLQFRGKTLIQNVVERLSAVFARVIVSAASKDSYPEVSIPVIGDLYPESGPVGGIVSVLQSGEQRIFCVACDMPFINLDLVEIICKFSGFEAVIPVWKGKTQVLHALYAASVLPLMEKSIAAGHLRITDALSTANIHYIVDEEIARIDPYGESFNNINTPQDYSALTESI